MIYVDANVLIRYYTSDHPELSLRAKELIESRAFFVTESVLVEMDFTFRASYKLTRNERVKVFSHLLSELKSHHDTHVDVSFELYKSYAKLSFADCLLMARSSSHELATFDMEIVRVRKLLQK